MAYTILPGSLASANLILSTTTFNLSDIYDKKLKDITENLANGTSNRVDLLFNHIFKYCHGEIASNDGMVKFYTRKPTAEEYEGLKEEGYINADGSFINNWPKDMLGIRYTNFDDEPNEDLLLDYDYNTFDLVDTFNLFRNNAVSYTVSTSNNGTLTSVTSNGANTYKTI